MALIKGALRRVFSRSNLRNQVLINSYITHSDLGRPRVKRWSRCNSCRLPVPSYEVEVDHISPVVPLDSSLEDMTPNDLVARTWCELSNLQALDPSCHKLKSKVEAAERAKFRKLKKLNNAA